MSVGAVMATVLVCVLVIDTTEGALCANVKERISGSVNPSSLSFSGKVNTLYLLRCDGTGTLTVSTCADGADTMLYWYNSNDCVNEVTSDSDTCPNGQSAVIADQAVDGGTDYVVGLYNADANLVITGGGSCTNLVGPSPECIARTP
ncbi:hypothetical protein Pelo_14276 [Pelomyxa schiedti]|nr:hypothetical protein Pelo_14276 [Pelomyxa schiedti]